MGQSVNSQVMALQAQLVLLRVRGCFVGRSDLWNTMSISGIASSGELCSLVMEKQSLTEPSAATCPPWHCLSRAGLLKGDGRFGKRITLLLAWGARQQTGKNRNNSGTDGCSKESQCMALCFPWNKKEVEWEQGSVNMIPALC